MITRFINYGDFVSRNRHQNHSSRLINDTLPYAITFSPVSKNYYINASDDKDVLETFSVKNVGNNIIIITGYVIDSNFKLVSDIPYLLFPEETAEITIEYTPKVVGSIFGNFYFKSAEAISGNSLLLYGTAVELWDHVSQVDDMLNALWVFLQGSVQDPLLSTEPFLNLNSVNYGFPVQQTINTTSGILTIPLNNSGTSELIIDNLVITGDFRIVP